VKLARQRRHDLTTKLLSYLGSPLQVCFLAPCLPGTSGLRATPWIREQKISREVRFCSIRRGLTAPLSLSGYGHGGPFAEEE
jgi:hypothetical protein